MTSASVELTSVDPLAPGHPNGNGNFGWAPLDSSESYEVSFGLVKSDIVGSIYVISK